MRLYLILLGLVLSMPGHTALPVHNAVPGGVAVIPLGEPGEEKPRVLFGQQPILVVADAQGWNAVVGLSQNVIPGKYIVTLFNADEYLSKKAFRVEPLPSSREQRTIILPERLRDLNIKPLSSDDQKNLQDGIADNSSEIGLNFEFRQIVSEGSYIPYGRVLRHQDSETLIDHPWITYITTEEEIIRSPASAIVDRIFFSKNSGISVVLHHGSGMKSIINHINETILKPGEHVESGDVIGTTRTLDEPEIGRVDWFLILNGSFVDPLQFTTPS